MWSHTHLYVSSYAFGMYPLCVQLCVNYASPYASGYTLPYTYNYASAMLHVMRQPCVWNYLRLRITIREETWKYLGRASTRSLSAVEGFWSIVIFKAICWQFLVTSPEYELLGEEGEGGKGRGGWERCWSNKKKMSNLKVWNPLDNPKSLYLTDQPTGII